MESNNANTNETIDFSGKDFKATQELLKETAKLNNLIKSEDEIREQKNMVLNQSVDDSEDIIQKHLDAYDNPEELKKYLSGDLKDPKVAERINSFFTNDETGEVLTLLESVNTKNEIEELDFKRGMLIYFKQNDYYMAQIDKEIDELNRTTSELNSSISEALDPLKDNILAYAEYLEQESEITEEDDTQTIIKKKKNLSKAKAIKSGYTFDNLIELIDKHPSIVKNALSDFRSDVKIKEIGKRYSTKLKTAKIDFNLFTLLSDDIHDSLEYRCLPLGEYPEGLENFTVFFIIRAMAMGLTSKEDIVFHASVQICLTRLMEGTLDEDVDKRVKDSIIRLLNKFA